MTHFTFAAATLLAMTLSACDFQQASYYDRYDHGAEIDFGEDIQVDGGGGGFDFSGSEFDKAQQRRKDRTAPYTQQATSGTKKQQGRTNYYRGSEE